MLVYGDTNSTLAGALAGADARRPGRRTSRRACARGDWSMPEERNRVEVDRLAALLFCPDERSREQLARRGRAGRAEVVGDVMADVTRLFAPVARDRVPLDGLDPGRYAVATVHREANVSQPRLGRIVEGLSRLNEPVVFPAHPRTREVLVAAGIGLGANVRLVEPLGYLDLAALASQARVILTDSGGLQKEAYWYGVPCVTLRPSTEWVDTVEVGANVLVDDDPDRIAGGRRRGPHARGAAAALRRRARLRADRRRCFGVACRRHEAADRDHRRRLRRRPARAGLRGGGSPRSCSSTSARSASRS